MRWWPPKIVLLELCEMLHHIFGPLILTPENCFKLHVGGLGPFKLSAERIDNLEVLASQVMLVSRGSSGRRRRNGSWHKES